MIAAKLNTMFNNLTEKFDKNPEQLNKTKDKISENIITTQTTQTTQTNNSPTQTKYNYWKSKNNEIYSENLIMLKRILYTKPFISVKKEDESYFSKHKKELERLRKIKASKLTRNNNFSESILPSLAWNKSTVNNIIILL